MDEFNPDSYEGKPRHLPKAKSAILSTLLHAVEQRLSAMTPEEQDVLLSACLQVSPINCGWIQFDIAKIVYYDVRDKIAARDSDGRSEAGETACGLDPKGNSAGLEEASPTPGIHQEHA